MFGVVVNKFPRLNLHQANLFKFTVLGQSPNMVVSSFGRQNAASRRIFKQCRGLALWQSLPMGPDDLKSSEFALSNLWPKTCGRAWKWPLRGYADELA